MIIQIGTDADESRILWKYKESDDWQRADIDELIDAYEDRPQGEWKPKNHHTDYCSNCGFEETQWRTADYNYCPNCGARMKGSDDE